MLSQPTVTVSLPSRRLYRTISGVTTLDTTDMVAARTTVLSVLNGNVQGDKKTPNPFYFKKTVTHHLQGNYTLFLFTGSGAFFHGGSQEWASLPSGPVTFNALPLDYSGLFDRAWGKIVNGSNGRPGLRSDAENVVDLAEGKQTGGMVANVVKTVVKAGKYVVDVLRNIRRRRPPSWPKWKPSEQSRWMSEKWLEYRYGWTPLLGSAYDAMDNFFKSRYAQERVERARVTQTTLSTSRSGSTWNFSASYNGSFGSPIDVWDFKSERCEIELVFRSDLSWLADYTSLNPGVIAWELVPFSFVADWFINVGGYLRQWDDYWQFNAGFHRGYRTYSGKSVTQVYVKHSYGSLRDRLPHEFGDRATGWIINGEAAQVITEKDRTVLSSLPTPHLPKFRPKIGWKQVVDTIALVKQGVKR